MLATALPPVLQAPVASPAPTHGAGSGNGPDSFARMLDAADARRQAQAQAQATAGKTPEAKPATDPSPDARDAAAPAAERVSDTAEETGTGEAAVRDGDTAAAEAAAATDPALVSDAAALLAGLAALPRPAPAEAAPRAAGAAASGPRGLHAAAAGVETTAAEVGTRVATETTDGTGATARPGAGPVPRTAADGKGEAFSQLVRQARGAEGAAEQAADSHAQRLQAAAPGVDVRPQVADTAGGPALPMAIAAAPGALHGGPGASAATPAQARLGASPGSPEFATQLGARLSTFVREGVQHARLELHPIELGPVTVQIALDGTLARVNMAAEHASTRQALEQAMPALAGSLREAGLTLSGGGVFEQPRQPQPDAGAAGSGSQGGRQGERGTAAAGGERAPVSVNTAPLRRRGVVDLVA